MKTSDSVARVADMVKLMDPCSEADWTTGQSAYRDKLGWVLDVLRNH